MLYATPKHTTFLAAILCGLRAVRRGLTCYFEVHCTIRRFFPVRLRMRSDSNIRKTTRQVSSRVLSAGESSVECFYGLRSILTPSFHSFTFSCRAFDFLRLISPIEFAAQHCCTFVHGRYLAVLYPFVFVMRCTCHTCHTISQFSVIFLSMLCRSGRRDGRVVVDGRALRLGWCHTAGILRFMRSHQCEDCARERLRQLLL